METFEDLLSELVVVPKKNGDGNEYVPKKSKKKGKSSSSKSTVDKDQLHEALQRKSKEEEARINQTSEKRIAVADDENELDPLLADREPPRKRKHSESPTLPYDDDDDEQQSQDYDYSTPESPPRKRAKLERRQIEDDEQVEQHSQVPDLFDDDDDDAPTPPPVKPKKKKKSGSSKSKQSSGVDNKPLLTLGQLEKAVTSQANTARASIDSSNLADDPDRVEAAARKYMQSLSDPAELLSFVVTLTKFDQNRGLFSKARGKSSIMCAGNGDNAKRAIEKHAFGCALIERAYLQSGKPQ